MSSEITVVGNLTDDPQFKYLPDGTAAARFTVASNQRVFQGGQWRDGDPTFVPVNAWRGLAENAVESLHKGDRVVVTGRLRTNTWTTQAGDKRSRLELTAEDLGPSLRFATARPERAAARAAAPAQTATQQASHQPPQTATTAHTPSAPASDSPAQLAAASFATPASGAAAGSTAGTGTASGANAALGLVPAAQTAAGLKDRTSKPQGRTR